MNVLIRLMRLPKINIIPWNGMPVGLYLLVPPKTKHLKFWTLGNHNLFVESSTVFFILCAVKLKEPVLPKDEKIKISFS